MISPAFRKADQARRRHKPVSVAQRRELSRLSRIAGVVMPDVYTGPAASKAIERLKTNAREPTLGRMG